MIIYIWPDGTVYREEELAGKDIPAGMSDDFFKVDLEEISYKEFEALLDKHGLGQETQILEEHPECDYGYQPDPMDIWIAKYINEHSAKRYATPEEAKANKARQSMFWWTLMKDDKGYWWQLDCLI